MFNTLITALSDKILIFTINRPEKLNALNAEVLKELNEVITEIETNDAISAAIITGAGEKAFVAGADISEFNKWADNEGRLVASVGQQAFFRIENCRKPIIACVNGFAMGGGCELAMACHFRIASTNAKFAQPEINLGIIPGYGGTQRLTQLIGKGRAMEMILTGNMIDAPTALQYGLVNKVVDQIQLLPTSIELLNVIINKAPIAIASSIKAINAATITNINGFEVELDGFAESFNSLDRREGVNAFLEKRKPNFIGK